MNRRMSGTGFSLFAAVLCGAGLFAMPLFAEMGLVTGKIQGINALGDGRYELVIQGDKETLTYAIGQSTAIEAEIEAKDIQEGETILLGAGRPGGHKTWHGLKAPGGDMSEAMKKRFHLPDIPNIPGVPEIPDKPPKIPKVPKKPVQVGAAPGKADRAEGMAAAPAAGAADLGSQAEKSARAETPPLPPPPPDERVFSHKPLSIPTGEPGPQAEVNKQDRPALPDAPKRVTQLTKSKDAIKVQLENTEGAREEVMLTPDQKVTQVLSASDLKKNMTVHLEVTAGEGGEVVERIVVA